MPRKHEEIRCGIFAPDDVEAMRYAFLFAASDGAPSKGQEDAEILARAIIRLYKMGLVDPQKLGGLAALMTSSSLFRSANVREAS